MPESRIKKTTKNIFFSFVFQFVKIALVFANRIIFVKILGATYLGINGLFSNILSILSLADLGLNTALMYSLYKPLATDDKKLISKYINYFGKVYNYIALAVLFLGIILTPFLKYLVNLPEEVSYIYLYYYLLLINSVISYLFVYKTTILSADQKMYIINKYDTCFQVILFILHVIILIITKSFALYLTCNIICTLISNLLKVHKTKMLYPYIIELKNEELDKEEKRKIFENVSSSFFYKIGGVIQSNTDNILISVFVGTITVGYFSNYSTIITSITSFVSLIFTSLKASLGSFVVSKDKVKQLDMFNNLEVYNYWLIAFCSISFFVLIPDFINLCFGESYLLSDGLLICTILNFYTSNIRQTMWAYRETTGLFKKTKYITIVTSIINIFLSMILGYSFGLIGIVAATVIARMIYAWWREPLILFRDYFETRVRDYFFRYIFRMILTAVLCTITFYCSKLICFTNPYFVFILKCALCVVLPNLILFLIYRNNQAILILVKK